MDAYVNPKYKKESIELTDSTIVEHSNVCVDDIKLNLFFDNDILVNAEYQAMGCAIFLSSCDLMIAEIMNKSKLEIIKLINNYFSLINGENVSQDDKEKLNLLNVFENVKIHYNRLECASIIYRAIKRGLNE
ncbi:Aminotransferase U-like protein [Metamycoplasma cloacale]|nr:iron-sulfur cluster assembly scaffold protein [Metamycoplasma cloacale]VEU79450.1 Aminotransferase U-like protein [Metamycoplasma cloacale]